jgi:hypothetical protein
MDSKTCPKCTTLKPSAEFYFDNRRRRLDSWCKCCRVEASGAYYRRKRPAQLAYARNYWLKDQYDITTEQYNALLESQNGVCALCSRPERTDRRLSVDHCHETGKVRGLLCLRCNSALGTLGDNEAGLLRALEYLRKPCPIQL